MQAPGELGVGQLEKSGFRPCHIFRQKRDGTDERSIHYGSFPVAWYALCSSTVEALLGYIGTYD